jgi:hypothetical protein
MTNSSTAMVAIMACAGCNRQQRRLPARAA